MTKIKQKNILIHHFKDKIVKQNKIKKKTTFGMFLIPAMRRASKFRELLTEKSSIFILKKAAIIFNYDQKKRKTFKSIILKTKSLIKTQIREKKHSALRD